LIFRKFMRSWKKGAKPFPSLFLTEENMKCLRLLVLLALACSWSSLLASQTIKIGIVFGDASSSASQKEIALFKSLGAQNGVEVLSRDAKGNTAVEISQILELIDAGVAVLIYRESDLAIVEALREAKRQGIALIRYDRNANYLPADVMVMVDYAAIGKQQGDWMASRFPKGRVLVLSGSPSDPVAKILHDSAMASLRPKIASGELKIVGDLPVENWDTSFAEMQVEKALSNGKFGAILAPNDTLAKGAILALKKRGLNGKVIVSGMDANLENARFILSGDQGMTILKDWGDSAKVALDVALQLSQKRDVAALFAGRNSPMRKYPYPEGDIPVIYIPAVLITHSNIRELVARGWYTDEELFP
jgi:D-xylose transport system substrate-binding protein